MNLGIHTLLTLASLHVVAPLLLKWKKQICFLVWLKVLEILNRFYYEMNVFNKDDFSCWQRNLKRPNMLVS